MGKNCQMPPTMNSPPTARLTRRLYERSSRLAFDAQSRCAGAVLRAPSTLRKRRRAHKMFERSMVANARKVSCSGESELGGARADIEISGFKRRCSLVSFKKSVEESLVSDSYVAAFATTRLAVKRLGNGCWTTRQRHGSHLKGDLTRMGLIPITRRGCQMSSKLRVYPCFGFAHNWTIFGSQSSILHSLEAMVKLI